MAKSSLEKAIEKQTKENQKAAREAKTREYASSIVSAQQFVSGFQVMDQESEETLQAILKCYDGNENNHMAFNTDVLPWIFRCGGAACPAWREPVAHHDRTGGSKPPGLFTSSLLTRFN